MQDDLRTPHRPVGFVGKLPSQPDFVRQNIGERIGSELDQWLVRSASNLQLAKVEWPTSMVRFVFSSKDCTSVAIGVAKSSQDQVGRSFPLVVYTSIPLHDAIADFNVLPLSHAEFLGEAEDLLAESAQLSAEALRSRVLALPTPREPMLTAAAERCRQLLHAAPAHELLTRLFPAHTPDAHLYGLLTFRTATDAQRAGPPASAPTVLACPIAIDVDLLAWLELARRCLGWRQACPSFAWVEEPTPRLLLAVGHAGDQLMHFLADPRHGSARLWPLTTDRGEAFSRARDLLGPALAPALTRAAPASIDELWAAVARAGL
jgi:type VI secretion system ImpM family protein